MTADAGNVPPYKLHIKHRHTLFTPARFYIWVCGYVFRKTENDTNIFVAILNVWSLYQVTLRCLRWHNVRYVLKTWWIKEMKRVVSIKFPKYNWNTSYVKYLSNTFSIWSTFSLKCHDRRRCVCLTRNLLHKHIVTGSVPLDGTLH